MNQNLPAFVVMTAPWTGSKARPRPIYNRLWGAGFLPSKYQGVALRSQRRPGAVPVQPARRRRRRPAGACSTRSAGSTSSELDAVGDPETQARIAQYEMAFRMQTRCPS